MTEATDAALGVLLRAARETATARRIGGDAESALLQSVVDAAAAIFEASVVTVLANARLMTFATHPRWVNWAPFGRPVVPEV